MLNIIKVDPNDKFRTLLTEVLPYELPIWFTNYNLYIRFKENLNIYRTVSGLPEGSSKLIPLNYNISRGDSSSPRTLSIMHPFAQLKVCDFYDQNSILIEYFCTKSQYSLRYPYRISTKFYGKTQKGSKVSHGVESVYEERIVSSSYFKYKKYPFLYRFFESYEYHRLEKKFHSMLQVDISKCFPSIYTHSIGWAVKNKKLAKEQPKGSFDGNFDELMQTTNYRETNGIIIGPEVSRIFAEVILQKIDLNLVDRMSELQYQISIDYDFRRYVDDYFIFYCSDRVRIDFMKSLELCLIEYKMYLNEAKTTILFRPFATNISLAKHTLKSTIVNCFNSRYKNGELSIENVTSLTRPDKEANKVISNIKMALAQYTVSYTSISNYLFSSINKKMFSYLSMLSAIDSMEDYHLNWVLVDLDVAFFIHAMDIRIRPTDRLARMINDILKIVTNWNTNHQSIIYQKIFDYVKQAINVFISNSNDIIGLETLNLLIILTMLPDKYQLTEKQLSTYFEQLQSSSSTNDFYFRWVTFMLYIRDNSKYDNFRKLQISSAAKYLQNHDNMFIDSEYFMFYFDYLACPYIDINIRKGMVASIKNITKDKKGDIIQFTTSTYINHLTKKNFIVSWNDSNYLQKSLEKKEYLFPYA